MSVAWGPRDVLKGLLLALALVGLFLVGAALSARLLGHLGGPGPPPAGPATGPGLPPELILVSTLLAEGALLVVAWYFTVRKYRCPWEELGFRVPPWSTTLPLIGLTFLASMSLNVLYVQLLFWVGLEHLLPRPPPLPVDQGNFGLIGSAVLVSLAAPLAEETFFRGFIYGGLSHRYGLGLGATLSAGLFALFHLDVRTFVPVFALGLLLCWIYAKTRSLWSSITVHLTYNSALLAAFVQTLR